MRRRGGVLIEVLLSIGLFVGAASFALSASRNVFSAFDRSRRTLEAVDLARSKLAELEAGLISVSDLREGGASGEIDVGSFQATFEDESLASQLAPIWVFEVDTQVSEFPGLSLVELTVTEEFVDDLTDENPVTVTLRQLMALRDEEAEAYEEDDILQDLPEDGR